MLLMPSQRFTTARQSQRIAGMNLTQRQLPIISAEQVAKTPLTRENGDAKGARHQQAPSPMELN
jgi:hypothetical protein